MFAKYVCQTCLDFNAVEFAMKETARLRKLEADCRQRAQGEPERKWYWLAQAAKYQVQIDREIAFHFEECNTPESNAPEVKLTQWAMVRDARRQMEPIAKGEQLDGFFRPEQGLKDRRKEPHLKTS
jgi:hypothetical protein